MRSAVVVVMKAVGSAAFSESPRSGRSLSKLQQQISSSPEKAQQQQVKKKKKSKETRVKAEVRQWIKSTVILGVVDSAVSTAERESAKRKKKSIKLSTVAVEEARRKREEEAAKRREIEAEKKAADERRKEAERLRKSDQTAARQAIARARAAEAARRSSAAAAAARETATPANDGPLPQHSIVVGEKTASPVTVVAPVSGQHQRKSGGSIEGGAASLPLPAKQVVNTRPRLNSDSSNRSIDHVGPSSSSSSLGPARSSAPAPRPSPSGMTVLRRSDNHKAAPVVVMSPANGNSTTSASTEQWPRGVQAKAQAPATSSSSVKSAPSKAKSWVNAVAGDSYSSVTATNDSEDVVGTTSTSEQGETTTCGNDDDNAAKAPPTRPKVVENAWRTKPKGALARGFAALQAVQHELNAAAEAPAPPRPTIGSSRSGAIEDDDSNEDAKNGSVADKEEEKPRRVWDGELPAALRVPPLMKTGTSQSTLKSEEDGEEPDPSSSAQQTPSVEEDGSNGQKESVDELHQAKTTRNLATNGGHQRSPTKILDQHQHAREEAEGAAYQARRASVGRQTEEERQRQIDETSQLDSEAAAERVAGRAWAVAQLEESHERKQFERRRSAGVMRKRLARDVDDFVRRLDAAMAPQRLARAAVLANVTDVVHSIWAHADCTLYGSCLTGLDLPSSDVDVVVRGLGGDPTPNPPLVPPRGQQQQQSPPTAPNGVAYVGAGGPHLPYVETAVDNSYLLSSSPRIPQMTPNVSNSSLRLPPQGGEHMVDGFQQTHHQLPPRGGNRRRRHGDEADSSSVGALAASSRDSNDSGPPYDDEEDYADFESSNNDDSTSAFGDNASLGRQRLAPNYYNNNNNEDIEPTTYDEGDPYAAVNDETASVASSEFRRRARDQQHLAYSAVPPGGVPMDPIPPFSRHVQNHLAYTARVPHRASTPTRADAAAAMGMQRQHYLRSPTPPAQTAPAGVVVCLKTLAAALSSRPWVREIKAIETASIPVIKLLADPALLDPPAPLPSFRRERRPHGEGATDDNRYDDDASPVWCGAIGRCDSGLLAVDISFEAPNHGGLASSRYALETMSRWPETTPLMLVLKEMLVQRNLNEPFTGGLSSYSLLLLVITAMQQAGVAPVESPGAFQGPRSFERVSPVGQSLASRIRDCRALGVDEDDDDDALGYLLTFFLDFFGRHFDPTTQVVSVLRGERGILQLQAPSYEDGQFVPPFIEDPLDISRNVARSCFGIAQIQHIFAHCLALLEDRGTANAINDQEVLSLILSY